MLKEELDKQSRCEVCNLSYKDINKSGRIGCANCYLVFKEQILTLLKKFHGTTEHKGKTP